MSDVPELPTAQLATDLVNEITILLSKHKLKEALSAINDNKYNACLKDNSWDLIPVITKNLDEDTNNKEPEVFDCCEKLLLVVAEKSNPEEALLEFIEQAETAKDDVTFFSVLKALQKTLLKLTTKRGRSLEWTFNTIQAHTLELPLPGEYGLENEEKIILDADESVQRITLYYSELLPFYKPFIDEVSLPNNQPDFKQRRDLLAGYMLQLLGKPLACLDLEFGVEAKSRGRICAEKIMNYLSELIGDCFKFLEYLPLRKIEIQDKNNKIIDDEIMDVFACDEKAPTLSLGVYYYLIMSENIQIKNIPVVYSPLYVFQSVFYAVAHMLQFSEQFITRKGLLLAHALICNENINVFPSEVLDSVAHCIFCKNLTNIIIYSDVKQYRELGIKIFKTYIFKFDLKGRYLLISNLMSTVKHVNTRGYIISQYKDMIREIFSKDENKIPEYFSGQKLFNTLDVFCHLPEGKETDLMEWGDQIITTLNLLIYLSIRDKYNATGIWNHFKNLEKTFFKPLKDGLIISKAHYELKIKELENEKGQGDSKFAVNVSGHNLPDVQLSSQTVQRHASESATSTAITSTKPTKKGEEQTDDQYDQNVKDKILSASLPFVKDLGWSKEALVKGAESIGYPGVSHGLFDQGAADLVHYFYADCNNKLVAKLKQETEGNKEIEPSKLINGAVETRLRMIVPYKSRWPQAVAIMALPPNIRQTLENLKNLADDICYFSGDRSVDFKWYARRFAVAGLYKTTELYMMQDQSEDHKRTWEFLNRRLEELFQIHDVLNQSETLGTQSPDLFSSAFTTAVYGIDWPR